MSKVLALLLGLFCTAPSWAATYFVVPGGAGSANGTSLANACTSINDADCNANAQPFSTVYLCDPGTGFSSASSSTTAVAFTLAWNGNCRDFGAQYSTRAKIINTGGAYNFSVTGSGDITLQNIEFAGGSSSDCINVNGTGSVTVDSSWIHDCAGDGVDFDGSGGKPVQLSYSTIEGADGAGVMTGATATKTVGKATIIGNIFRNNGITGTSTNTDAIAINDDTAEALIAYNDIEGQLSEVGSGIDTQNSTSPGTSWVFVVGNFIKDCAQGPGLSSTGSQSALFTGNIVINCNNGALPKGTSTTAMQWYYNNLFIGNRSSAVKVATTATGAAKAVDLANNIFFNNLNLNIANDVATSTFTSNYNDFVGGTGFKDANAGAPCSSSCTLAQWQALSRDVNSLTVDPQFVESTPTSRAGACLKSTSPLIGAGIGLPVRLLGYGNEDFGNPPAIGARKLCRDRQITPYSRR